MQQSPPRTRERKLVLARQRKVERDYDEQLALLGGGELMRKLQESYISASSLQSWPTLRSYVARNFTQIAHIPEFLELAPDVLHALIESPDVRAPPHFQLRAVYRWVRHDTSTRADYLPRLARAIPHLNVKNSNSFHIAKDKFRRSIVLAINLPTAIQARSFAL